MANLTATLQVRLPKDVFVAVEQAARRSGLPTSRLVRGWIDAGLAQEAEPDVLIPAVTPGVGLSALPPPGGEVLAVREVVVPTTTSDPVLAEVVSDGPKHWHRREPVETHWERGQKVTTYRCKDCGASLT